MPERTLRYATISLKEGPEAAFDPLEGSSEVSIETTRYLGPIEAGEYVGLSDLRGDVEEARRRLDRSERVLGYDLAGDERGGILYARYRSVGAVGDLLSILYEEDLVLDWPIEHRRSEAGPTIRFTVVGTAAGIQRAAAEIPEGVSLSVERVGRARDRDERSPLTDRQRALLALAIEEGYYEVPRETTHRALAERLGVSAGTVSDRLQRIERRVMGEYADRLG